jgi:hypothetical protein
MVGNATYFNSDGQQCHLFKQWSAMPLVQTVMVSNATYFNSDGQQCHLLKQ